MDVDEELSEKADRQSDIQQKEAAGKQQHGLRKEQSEQGKSKRMVGKGGGRKDRMGGGGAATVPCSACTGHPQL